MNGSSACREPAMPEGEAMPPFLGLILTRGCNMRCSYCCAGEPEHQPTPTYDELMMQQINEAYERMIKADVKYRFSIDLKSLEE